MNELRDVRHLRISSESLSPFIGIFIMPQEPVSAWLGWFGILEKYRRRGYGSLALEMFEAEARKRGYLFARLYTGRFHNDAAKAFYEINGYI